MIIYVDESGDLGWKFDLPYRTGGSSRYLTITAVCVPPEKKHIPKRVIFDLYDTFKWPTSQEKKWVDMDAEERTEFARSCRTLRNKHPDIFLHAIVVKKQNVGGHIRTDGNKLYNYMIGLALLDRMAGCPEVTMVPDPRSIKVQSGNSLPDYLQTQLWFAKNVETILRCHPTDSKNCSNLQFADMLAGLVQSHFENGDTADFQIVAPKIRLNRLFFGG